MAQYNTDSLADITDDTSEIASGQPATASSLTSYIADVNARIAALNDAVQALATNQAGGSASANREGSTWADTSTNPATLKYDPDGSGPDTQLISANGTANAAVWPSFRAYLSSAQLNITGVAKVLCNTEVFDTNTDYDNVTNYRFTPTAAGKYLLIGQVTWTGSSMTDGDILSSYIYKNGSSDTFAAKTAAGTGNVTTQVMCIADANGTTDYFEMFAENANRDTSDLTGSAIASFFCGSRIA